MIINQGYPLWVVVHGRGRPAAVEAVIAWEIPMSSTGVLLHREPPDPITAESGTLDSDQHGGYMSTAEEAEKTRRALTTGEPRPR